MEEITWDDVRVGQFLVITQDVPAKGPRRDYHITWAGKVVEHNAKQTILKHGAESMSVPQKWGVEAIMKMSKKDFDTYLEENEL